MANESTSINKDIINGLKDTIRNLYLSDAIPWVIGYSGGKDSTATLQLVWLALAELPSEKLNKAVHIINTDTLVESPVIEKWVEKSLLAMKKAADEQKLPFVTHRLTPQADQTYWVNLLGRGYPFPRKKFRWCTDRLKIRPVNDFVKNCIEEHGEIILVLGTRKAESANRAKTMAYYEKKRVRELLSPNPTLANELVFAPLSEWTDNDVWMFLMQYKNPWGYHNNDLLTMYRGATADGECPLMVEKGLPSCGKSRFGCWVCTMVEQDKSMEAMITNDAEKEWLTPLLEFRNEIGNEEEDRSRRDFRRRGGYLQGSKGQLNHGPYVKDIREKWLRQLLSIQRDINLNGPEEYRSLELISIPELKEIRRIWVNENHEFDDSLPTIYREVMGKPFPDQTIYGSRLFGSDEWELLKQLCSSSGENDQKLLFQMMYSLVDIENNSNVMNNRKGILDRIEKAIRQNFFKDEADAKSFYYQKMERKRDMGGKYDERAFDDVLPENDEFEDEPA